MKTQNIKRIIANMRSIFISDSITAVDAREIADTLEAQAKRIAELEQVAQAVVDRWDTPLWKDVPATAEYINELREALK